MDGTLFTPEGPYFLVLQLYLIAFHWEDSLGFVCVYLCESEEEIAEGVIMYISFCSYWQLKLISLGLRK